MGEPFGDGAIGCTGGDVLPPNNPRCWTFTEKGLFPPGEYFNVIPSSNPATQKDDLEWMVKRADLMMPPPVVLHPTRSVAGPRGAIPVPIPQQYAVPGPESWPQHAAGAAPVFHATPPQSPMDRAAMVPDPAVRHYAPSAPARDHSGRQTAHHGRSAVPVPMLPLAGRDCQEVQESRRVEAGLWTGEKPLSRLPPHGEPVLVEVDDEGLLYTARGHVYAAIATLDE